MDGGGTKGLNSIEMMAKIEELSGKKVKNNNFSSSMLAFLFLQDMGDV